MQHSNFHDVTYETLLCCVTKSCVLIFSLTSLLSLLSWVFMKYYIQSSSILHTTLFWTYSWANDREESHIYCNCQGEVFCQRLVLSKSTRQFKLPWSTWWWLFCLLSFVPRQLYFLKCKNSQPVNIMVAFLGSEPLRGSLEIMILSLNLHNFLKPVNRNKGNRGIKVQNSNVNAQ